MPTIKKDSILYGMERLCCRKSRFQIFPQSEPAFKTWRKIIIGMQPVTTIDNIRPNGIKMGGGTRHMIYPYLESFNGTSRHSQTNHISSKFLLYCSSEPAIGEWIFCMILLHGQTLGWDDMWFVWLCCDVLFVWANITGLGWFGLDLL